jgi:hypothetical protein
MSILWSDCGCEGGWEPFVFLAGFSHRAPGHEILQFLIRSQTEHLLTAASRISRAQVFVHYVEELLELERCTSGKHRN